MEGSERAYDRLIARIEERLPEVAAQIRGEVARGRPLSVSRIPESERKTRQVRLDEVSLGRIGTNDVAVEPYSSDEQLAVLVDALRTLVMSMIGSRRVVEELVTNSVVGSAPIGFAAPSEDQAVTTIAREDLIDDTSRLARAADELSAALDTIRPRP